MKPPTKRMFAASGILALTAGVGACAQAADTTLIDDGVAKAAVVVPDDAGKWERLAAEELRTHLQRMSGAELPAGNAAQDDGTVNIFIGAAAPAPGLDAIREGGDDPASFRLAVDASRIQLTGLSGKATLYAAYELLEQLGVRWFMPGEIGTVVPESKTVSIPQQETIEHPGFQGRHLQAVAAPTWRRRMRLGGLDTGRHGLGPPFNSETEPELFIHENGKPTNQVDVAKPEVLERVVDHWMKRLERNPEMKTLSMGPQDGTGFGSDHPWDADDVSPLDGEVSVTDRYVKFFNMVLDRIHEKYPDVRLGFYAYGQCMRPPVRETPDPKLLPMLAPIDLCRIHTVHSPHCWERQYMGKIIDGWHETGVKMMYRGYYFNLCNPGIPYSMTRQIADELPFFHDKGIIGCRVETMTAWAFHGPSLYLASRLMWDPKQDAEAVLDDYYSTFFGPAGGHVERYFDILETAHIEADYHTGNVFDIPKILTEKIRARMGREIRRAERAVSEKSEYGKRVQMIRDGFTAGERILDTITASNACEFGRAKKNADAARELLKAGMEQTPPRFDHSVGIGYFNRFWARTVDHGYECTHGGNEKVLQLPDEWRFMLDPYASGEELGLWKPELGSQPWRTLRTYSQSWSNQGLRYYKGDCWYRTSFEIPKRYRGRELIVWFGGVDNDLRVWINGTELEMTKRGASPIGRPWMFATEDTLRFDQENVIAVRVRNDRLRELGTGGLTGPVMIWAKSDD